MKPSDLWLQRQCIRCLRGMLSAWEEWVKRREEENGVPSKELK